MCLSSGIMSWSPLPEDILLLILTKLRNLPDYVRFRSVCRSWRLISEQDSNTPRRLFPGLLAPDYQNRCFYNYLPSTHFFQGDNRINGPKLRLPPQVKSYKNQDREYVGCYQGWLVLVESGSMKLLNPITRATFDLPSLDTIPQLDSNYVERAVLSSNPSSSATTSPCYVSIIHGHEYYNRKLAFCKLGDSAWKSVDVTEADGDGFEGATFYKGKFLVTGFGGNLYAFDVDSSSPICQKIVGSLYRLGGGQNLGWEWVLCAYYCLVEFHGELLMVLTKTRGVAKGMKLYKLDWSCKNWVGVRSLGDYALFLGCYNSCYVSELDVAGIRGNRIYYVLEAYMYTEDNYRVKISVDAGVFNVSNSMIEVSKSGTDLVCPFWFSPDIW